ncbi:SUPPRESSOR OF ABI3-5 [Nymphaea colorata]|nr:SUPPRESSOR OF ABI3-5 [Nymphaea colorata]XP_031491661.1 SUPPRESSOR OF ABI3-5 [Nymphaea colorata]XP_031491662.1 SUPPRESSOR OF ABI3-5 [Nymphaea colorata]
MAEEEPSSSRSHLKRRAVEDLISEIEPNKRPKQREVKFPKGKKAKQGVEPLFDDASAGGGGPVRSTDPRVAAKERAVRRNQITAELFKDQDKGTPADIASAEVDYEDEENLDDEGVPIEPFNLNKEREEGYFDSAGNFVEYRVEKDEIKDAWIDSVGVSVRPVDKSFKKPEDTGDDYHDLSSAEIGRIKRRIANLLEPGETVLHALRRLKGTSNDKGKRGKMSGEAKALFDQLTDDSMKLMESGDYNVYHDKQETFVREAEGYERIASAKDGKPADDANDLDSHVAGETFPKDAEPMTDDIFSNDADPGVASISMPNSVQDMSADHDAFDMFGEEDETGTSNPTTKNDGVDSDSISPPSQAVEPSEDNPVSQSGDDQQTDYVFDESSGYYYSASLGYYYDPTSGLFCCSTSGKWYAFNEQSNTYVEVQEDGSFVAS